MFIFIVKECYIFEKFRDCMILSLIYVGINS